MDFNNKNLNDDEEVLCDLVISSKGETKINDWRGKKLRNIDLARSYKRIYKNTSRAKKYVRVLECAEYLEFKYENEKDKQGKLHRAFFCKDRLCATCNWRRTKKVYAQASAVMNEAVKQDYQFVFLTLTVKNVKSEELDETVKKMMKSFSKMTKRKSFKDAFKGFFRALEVTYNRNTDEYHPHFHIVLAVNKSYFTSRLYLSQEQVAELWKNVMDLDYNPMVDIRKFKAATEKQLAKSVAEVAKYTVKDSDYLIKNSQNELDIERTDKVVFALAEALFNKRLIAWGGILKDIHKKLNLDDCEDGDLIITSDEDASGSAFIIRRYRWGVGLSGQYDYFREK